jgi:hypothetical protein
MFGESPGGTGVVEMDVCEENVLDVCESVACTSHPFFQCV